MKPVVDLVFPYFTLEEC